MEGHPLQNLALVFDDHPETPHDYSSIAEGFSNGRDQAFRGAAVGVSEAEKGACTTKIC